MRWQPAELLAAHFETPSARTLTLRIPGWPGHLPGQHLDVRLTAPDGYRAERSYSLSAPAAGDTVEITIQRVPDGEVSGYLVDHYPVGALIEVRGPIGGWFVWNPETGGPAVLVAGGSGIVPLAAMLRARRKSGNTSRFRLIYSLRDPADMYYREELVGRDHTSASNRPREGDRPRPDSALGGGDAPGEIDRPRGPGHGGGAEAGSVLGESSRPGEFDRQDDGAADHGDGSAGRNRAGSVSGPDGDGGLSGGGLSGSGLGGAGPVPIAEGIDLLLAFTRGTPPEFTRSAGRLTAEEIAAYALPPAPDVTCFVCGPTPFVEFAAAALVSAGHDPAMIKTERFGPTGK